MHVKTGEGDSLQMLLLTALTISVWFCNDYISSVFFWEKNKDRL